ARSAAYNRTLTPFLCQGAERDLCQEGSVDANMSPVFHAEKNEEPILRIRGQEEPNSVPFPVQSERMFAAISGLGRRGRF
ncbi:hypothetical protein, partial [Pseudoalteromonas sp. S1691]|uniref:hypothetical protein n=1 Tax=Pseudoalteromonas sp. S1691 TaxID=579513 RepID=UPI001D8E2B63